MTTVAVGTEVGGPLDVASFLSGSIYSGLFLLSDRVVFWEYCQDLPLMFAVHGRTRLDELTDSLVASVSVATLADTPTVIAHALIPREWSAGLGGRFRVNRGQPRSVVDLVGLVARSPEVWATEAEQWRKHLLVAYTTNELAGDRRLAMAPVQAMGGGLLTTSSFAVDYTRLCPVVVRPPGIRPRT